MILLPKRGILAGICVLIAACVVTRSAYAPLGASGHMAPSRDLLRRADAIYAGKAVAIRDGKEDLIRVRRINLKGRWRTAEFAVDHVIRGQAADSVEIEFFESEAGMRSVFTASIPVGRRCMVLLRAPRERGGPYALLDTDTRVVLLSPTPPRGLVDKKTETERLEAEFGAALESNDLRIVLQAVECVELLDLHGRDVMVGLQKASRNEDTSIASLALGTRITFGDVSAVPAARALLESAGDSPAAVSRIGLALRTLTAADHTDLLKGLMGSKSVELRRGASYALRKSEGKDVLPILAAALDDPDIEVQYNAVMGIAQRVEDHGTFAPAYALFEQDPGKYVDYWRKWWAQNGGEVDQSGDD